MGMTARQVVADELIRWLDTKDIGRFTDCQRLEYETRIWEFGKWCAKEGDFLGIKPQIRFRGSRPESTAWDAIQDIPDEEGLRIHEAYKTLTVPEHNIIQYVYLWWCPPHVAIEKMRIGSDTFYRIRYEALKKMHDILCGTVDTE